MNDSKSSAVPSKLVDLVWHLHILDTKAYFADCKEIFGKYIHHSPTLYAYDDSDNDKDMAAELEIK